MSSFDELLSNAEKYLINEANYTSEQANQLSIACDDNEFKEIELLTEDFSGLFEDSTLIDDVAFTETFPNLSDRKTFFTNIQYALKLKEAPIHRDIQEQKQPSQPSPPPIYKYDEILNLNVSDINESDLQQTRILYARQAQQILSKNDDKSFWQILALGRKLGIPLMLHLADTYSRMKINGHIKDFTQFKGKYKLLKELRFPQTKHSFGMAPASFHARGLPETQTNPLIKIDDQIYHFYQYGTSCIMFIANLVSSSDRLTPFQMDFWLIPRSSGPDLIGDEGEDSVDDSDDSDSDDSNANMNGCVDTNMSDLNVCDILESEALLFKRREIKQSELDKGLRADRLMRDEYKQFVQDLKQKTNEKNAPQFGRFNMILDRRKRNEEKTENEKDEFFIYKMKEDPFDAIHVPEIYIANSKKVTLPKKGYSQAQNEMDRNLLTYSASDQLNGSNFILSFHVEAVDNIKCYNFFNGGCVRFFPEDMITIWPNWFKKSEENDKFLERRQIHLKALEQIKIRDDKFEQWYKMTTGFDDLHQSLISKQ